MFSMEDLNNQPSDMVHVVSQLTENTAQLCIIKVFIFLGIYLQNLN